MGILSAMQELSMYLRTIQPVMTDPNIDRKKKRRTLNNMVNSLSKDTLKKGFVRKQIIKIINMKEDVCKEYKDMKSQVDGIIGWLPRFKDYRKDLEKAVTKARKECGLKV